MTVRQLAFLAFSFFALASNAESASWMVDGCGRGGTCPDQFSPTATPTQVYSPTVSPTPSPSITGTPATPTMTPTITPSPTFTRTPVGGAFALKIDVGAATGHSDGSAPDWVADRAYAGGSYGYMIPGSAYQNSEEITGTLDDATYRNFRQAISLEYFVNVPNGNYEVTLKFCEFTATAAGQRNMRVNINGTIVASSIDLYSAAGPSAAYDRTYYPAVADGRILIQITGLSGLATLSGIEVRGLQQLNPLQIFLREPINAQLLP